MKTALISIFMLLLAGMPPKLDYPINQAQIKSVELIRPAKVKDGVARDMKELTDTEIRQLLYILQYAAPVSPKKFKPDYYIVFKTTDNQIKRLIMYRDYVKDESSAQIYELRRLSYMVEF